VDGCANARLEVEPVAAEIEPPGEPGRRIVSAALRVDTDNEVNPRLEENRQLVERCRAEPTHDLLPVFHAAERNAVGDVVRVDPQHRFAGHRRACKQG
jgi:hypothetical protein